MTKKTKLKFLLSLVLIVLLISTCCYATETAEITDTSDDAITISDEELAALLSSGTTSTDTTTSQATDTSDWVNSDLFKFDQSVTISEIVDGNAYVIANEVTVTGEIGGDLFVIANKLNIDGGYVYSSIFAIANEITMNGISYDLYAMCSSFNLGSDGFVYRDMRVAGGNVSLAGRIRRDAHINSASLTFDETVGTVIYGNLNYTSTATEYTAPEGVVAGDVIYTQETSGEVPSVDAGEVAKVSIGAIIIRHIRELVTALVTTLIVALLFAFLAPKFIEKLGNMSVGKAFASLGVGIISPFVLGLACVLLIIVASIIQIAGVGLSVSATAFFVFITLSVVATAIASTYLGKLFTKLAKKDGKLFFVLFSLLSALLIWAIDLIPVLGGLVSYLVWAFGVGAVILNVLPKKSKSEKAE